MISNPSPEGRGGGRAGGRKGRGRGGRPAGREGGRSNSGGDPDAANAKGRGGRTSSKRGRGRNAEKNSDGRAGGRVGGRSGNKPPQPSVDLVEKQKQEEEEKQRREAEAERKRLEKLQREALEKRKQEIAALEERMRNAIDTVKQFTDVKVLRQASRKAMANLAEARKEFESNKKKLKTDLKKCTAFVKKIRSGSAWSNSNIDTNDVVKDVSNLNLSRYVDEIVTAIVESKPKIADLPVVVALCQAMDLRYEDFLSNLLRAIWSVINTTNKNDPETSKLRRVYFRLVTQLHLSGLSVDVKPIVKCIAEAVGAKVDIYTVQDANILVAFAKAASPDIFEVIPKSVQDSLDYIRVQLESRSVSVTGESAQDAPEKMTEHTLENDVANLPPLVVSAKLLEEAFERKALLDSMDGETGLWDPDDVGGHKILVTHCKGAYKVLSNSLVQTHVKLQKLVKRCDQDRLLAGSLTEAREKGLEDARKLKDSLQKTVEALADVMALAVPNLLEEEESDFELSKSAGVEVWTKGADEEAGDFGPFDDEETRAFYCDIPDLLATIPPALLGMSEDDIESKTAENAVKYGSGSTSVVSNEDMTVEITSVSEEQLDAEEAEAEKDKNGDDSNLEGMYANMDEFD
jgi:regulator of nonsense transcripts 2